MKQIYPATITGKSFAPGGSVLDHNFGKGDPYTLGVEEEYMLLDGETAGTSCRSMPLVSSLWTCWGRWTCGPRTM